MGPLWPLWHRGLKGRFKEHITSYHLDSNTTLAEPKNEIVFSWSVGQWFSLVTPVSSIITVMIVAVSCLQTLDEKFCDMKEVTTSIYKWKNLAQRCNPLHFAKRYGIRYNEYLHSGPIKLCSNRGMRRFFTLRHSLIWLISKFSQNTSIYIYKYLYFITYTVSTRKTLIQKFWNCPWGLKILIRMTKAEHDCVLTCSLFTYKFNI